MSAFDNSAKDGIVDAIKYYLDEVDLPFNEALSSVMEAVGYSLEDFYYNFKPQKDDTQRNH